jgi:hypothetical protein
MQCVRFEFIFWQVLCGAKRRGPEDGLKQHPPFYSFVFCSVLPEKWGNGTLFGELEKYSTFYLLFLTPADVEPAKQENLRAPLKLHQTLHFPWSPSSSRRFVAGNKLN